MRDVTTILAQATNTYADVLLALNDAGLPTVVTQTGGLCGALEITLETGQHLLITDAHDTLPWDRSEHAGWGVGLYPRDDEYTGGHLACADTEASDVLTLLGLVRQVLTAGARGARSAGEDVGC